MSVLFCSLVLSVNIGIAVSTETYLLYKEHRRNKGKHFAEQNTDKIYLALENQL
jgi:hypothetical protein